MKKLSFIILLSFIFIGICNANPEDNSVYLQTTNQNQLSAPKTKTDLLNRANSMTKYTSYEDLEEQEYFEAEKDITDNAAANRFYKFIDNTLINNKFNNFSSKVGDKIQDRF